MFSRSCETSNHGARSLSVSQLSDVRRCCGDAPGGIRVFGFHSAVTPWHFGLVLNAGSTHDDRNHNKNTWGMDDDGGEGGDEKSRRMATTSTTLSWDTVKMLAKDIYLHDVVCSQASSAALCLSPALSSAICTEKSLSTSLPLSSPLPPAITAWEHLLCALLFRTTMEEMVSLPRAMSWRKERFLEEMLSAVRRWTGVLVDGFFCWVPPCAGVRLLLSSCVNANVMNLDGSGGPKVGLLDVEDVSLLPKHWSSLRRFWLTGREEMITKGAANVLKEEREEKEDLCASLYCTVRVFRQHGKLTIPHLLAHAMAVVAHIESYLETSLPSFDASCDVHDYHRHHHHAAEDAVKLPYTTAQRNYLVELLAFLLVPSENRRSEGKRAATQWMWTHLGAEEHVALFNGPSKLLFHDFLASFSHWLVLQTIPVLLQHVNLVSCSGPEDASWGTGSRSVRLRFQRLQENVQDQTERLHMPVATSSPTTKAGSRRNVLSEVTMSAWLRWLRYNHVNTKSKNTTNGGGGMDAKCPLHVIPSLSLTGAGLLTLLDSLRLFDSISTKTTLKAVVAAPFSDRTFERHGARLVAHWAVGCSLAETLTLCREQIGALTFTARPQGALQMFTLAEFMTRYRPIVDAARLAHFSFTRHEEEAAAGRTWHLLPPQFDSSFSNFYEFAPINQAKLICLLATVDHAVCDSLKEKGEEKKEGLRRQHADSCWYMDVFSENPPPSLTVRRPSVIITEDSGVVNVHACAALERLEVARLRAQKHLYENGTLILQAFLRACWSKRWNLVPLRCCFYRRAIIIVQLALRMRGAARRVEQQARRWLEEPKRHDTMCEGLICGLEVQTEERRAATVDVDRGDNTVRSASVTPGTFAFLQATSFNVLLRERLRGIEAVSGNGDSGNIDCLPPAESCVGCKIMPSNNSVAGVLFAMETKGRDVVQRVEAKKRCQLLLSLENKIREGYIFLEHRDRRAVVRQCVEERKEALVKEDRRRRRKLENDKKTTRRVTRTRSRQQQPHSVTRTGKKTTHGVASSAATARNSEPVQATLTENDKDDASYVVIEIDVQDDEERGVEDPVQTSHAALRCPLTRARRTSPSMGLRVCASSCSLCSEPSVAAKTSPGHSLGALGRQEHEERAFIELSQGYCRRVLQQTCARAGITLMEMLQRRLIFLSGVLERREMLERWRTIVLPYCLITEALHDDFIAVSVTLQNTPRRRGVCAVRTACGLRNRRMNSIPAVTSRKNSSRRDTPLSGRQTGRRQGLPFVGSGDEKDENKRHSAASEQTVRAQRAFLSRPNFHLLSGRSCDPCMANTRSVGAIGERKTSTARKRFITWADLPTSSA